jgi:erythronate-4-phosphate dehydrogenase
VAGYSLEAKLAATRMMHEALCAFLGRAPSWSEAELLEPRLLTGPLEGFSSPARVIARVVDLAGDDARVRALVELPLARRAAAFERLRREYELRREFRSWRIPGAGDPAFLAWLRASGFSWC